MIRTKKLRPTKNRCKFCTKDGCPRPAFVDYKDVQTLKKLCTSQGKLFSRKRSGNCAAFQRAVLMKTPEPYFCLDGTKLGKRTPYRVSAWDKRVRLITDLAVNDLAEAGISLSPEQLFSVGN